MSVPLRAVLALVILVCVPPATWAVGPTVTVESGVLAGEFNGSVRVDTCSAETTVPWITRTSRPAASTIGAYFATRCGVSDAHEVTPPARISSIRRPMRSSLIGSR